MARTPDGRFAGFAGVAGGVGWALLAVAEFAVGAGGLAPSYRATEALAPVALALAFVGLVGYRVRTRDRWGRLAAAGFLLLFAGLAGSVAGAAGYALAGSLRSRELFVLSHLLALVGATTFGAGLLRTGVPPRAGAALLAGTLPVGFPASFALAVALGDGTVVALGPAAAFGTGVAALGWWLRGRPAMTAGKGGDDA